MTQPVAFAGLSSLTCSAAKALDWRVASNFVLIALPLFCQNKNYNSHMFRYAIVHKCPHNNQCQLSQQHSESHWLYNFQTSSYMALWHGDMKCQLMTFQLQTFSQLSIFVTDSTAKASLMLSYSIICEMGFWKAAQLVSTGLSPFPRQFC